MCESLFEVDTELKASLEEEYPGLRVKGRNADGSICCRYSPINHAKCVKCGYAYVQKNGFNQPKRIKDLFYGKPIVLSVAFQRYKCPNCCSVLRLGRTPLSYSFSGTSKRLEEYIVNQYPLLGSEYILSSFDSPGFISEAEIRKIFERYTSNYIDQYHEDLEAPEALGLHLISSGKRNYYVLSDLVQQQLIDIFPQDEKLALNLFLKQLPCKEQTIYAVTDIDLDCLDAINRQFRNGKTIVLAANASLYKSYVHAMYPQVIATVQRMRGKNLFLQWFTASLAEDRDIDPVELEKVMRNIKKTGIKEWIETQERIRKVFLNNWNCDDYKEWVDKLAENSTFSNLCAQIDFASREINNSFTREAIIIDAIQAEYSSFDSMVEKNIIRNQRCSFDSLRGRLFMLL